MKDFQGPENLATSRWTAIIVRIQVRSHGQLSQPCEVLSAERQVSQHEKRLMMTTTRPRVSDGCEGDTGLDVHEGIGPPPRVCDVRVTCDRVAALTSHIPRAGRRRSSVVLAWLHQQS
jgi:hypothetical protein